MPRREGCPAAGGASCWRIALLRKASHNVVRSYAQARAFHSLPEADKAKVSIEVAQEKARTRRQSDGATALTGADGSCLG